MYKLVILAFLFMGSIQWAKAQNTVFVTVNDIYNQPITEATVTINNQKVSKDVDQKFIANLPSGKHHLLIQAQKFETLDTLVYVSKNEVLNLKLSNRIGEVYVTNDYTKSQNIHFKQKISQEEITHNNFQNLGNALKGLSGLNALKSGNNISKPVINGLHSNRVLILNQNVRMEDQQWGLEHAPNLDINAIENIEVIKGAQALRFAGDAIGGVVLLDNKPRFVSDTIYGQSVVTAQTNGRGITASSNINRSYNSGWFYKFQGTFKYLGDLETPHYVLSNSGNREKNISASFGHNGENAGFDAFLSYYNATVGIAKNSHIGNIADLANAINSGKPIVVDPFSYDIDAPKQQLNHYLAKVNFYQYLKNSAKLQLQYAFQMNDRFEYDIRRNSENKKPSLDLNLVTNSLQVDYEQDLNQKWNIKLGSQFQLQQNSANPETGIRPLIPNYHKVDLGLFAITSFALNEKTSAEFGLRFDYSKIDATKFYLKSRWNERGYHQHFEHFITGNFNNQWKTNPVFTYQNVAASLGAKHQLSEQWKLYLNVNFANRNPNASELFSDGLHHSTGQIELGNLNLKKESSYRLATTISFNNQNLALDIAPFYNFIEDYIFLQPIGIEQNIRGAFPVWEYQQTNAHLYGVDTQLNWKINRNWDFKSSLAIVKARDLTQNRDLIDMPATNIRNTISVKFPALHQLKLEVQNEWVFTQKDFPNNDFLVEIPTNSGYETSLLKISQPPKGYNLWQFSARIPVLTTQAYKAEIGLLVHNILNTTYRDYLNKNRYYSDETGRNILLQFIINY